jgi:small GTP-binding protein
VIILIQYINILTRDGKSLLYRNYGSSDVDRDLLAGFLSAFSGFMKEISKSDIKSTATDEFKYFYTIIDEIIIVVCSDLEDEDAVINTKITGIKVKFIEEYGELLSSGEWTGNRSIFRGFEREIDESILGPIKISIIGTGGVGKTTLVHRICGEDINLEYQPTINVDIMNYDGEEIGVDRSIALWDFAGQSNYRSLWKSLLDSTVIALLVLDSSFENVNKSKEIIQDILDKHYKDALVIGIANKQDLSNRLTPKFCEDILSQAEREPPIKVHGMIATNPDYREKILAILRDAINKISNTSEPS